MGLFDTLFGGLFGGASQQGAQATQQVIGQQPTTSSGQPYVTPAPQQQSKPAPAPGGSTPTPVQHAPGSTVQPAPAEGADVWAGFRTFFQTTPILSTIYGAGQEFSRLTGIVPTLPQPSASPTNPIPQMISYPLGEAIRGAGLWYESTITKPYEAYITPRLEGHPGFVELGRAGVGFLGVPGAAAQFIGSAIPGAERLTRETIRDPLTLPGYAAAGLVMQGQGLYRGITTDPFKTGAELVGTYALLEGGIGGIRYGTGIARTFGREYIPIERIGYGPEWGYPLNPKIGEANLMRSFRESSLFPSPSRMSLSERVPYVPEAARLPTDIPSQNIMWTAWESTPKGSRFTLLKGSSEIPGMYGAPVAESYFAKVGGQMPEVFGFDFRLFNRPSLVHTTLKGFEPVPPGVRGGSFDVINRYISKNLEGGIGYLPLKKVEYEAVLPAGNVLEIMGSRYYTKVGGIELFGKRLFGTRLPIIETRATGEIRGPAVPEGIRTISYEAYKSGPLINVPSLGVSALTQKVSSISPGPRQMSIGTASSPGSTNIGTVQASSRISSEAARTYTPSFSSVVEKYSSYIRPPRSSFPSAASSPRMSIATPRYTPPRSPTYTPPRSPTYTPPGSPSTPTFSPPRTPPYSPPSTPPYSPPSTPPFTPPRTPPYTPPATPPATPPPVPPINEIALLFDWERSLRQSMPKVRVNVLQWNIRNPVPTLESVMGAVPNLGAPTVRAPSFKAPRIRL